MSALSMWFLGGFRACLDGEPVTAFASSKVQALLAYLAVESGRPHRRESLAGLLWVDYPERSARINLSNALSSLRTAIGDREATPPYLLVSRETIQLNPQGDHWVDATAFQAAVEGGQWEEAVGIYRGPFLGGFSVRDSSAFEQWTLVVRERLQRLAMTALGALAAACEEELDYRRACELARQQLEIEPWHEAAHRALMRALALSGDRAAGLAHYEACRRTLEQELGVAPDAETTRVSEQIREGKLVLPAASSPRLSAVQAPPSKHNLPVSIAPFVGREEELAQLTALLQDPACRLVTLVGPGGIGKTRLALQCVADVAAQAPSDRFPDGIYFVPLAPVHTVDAIVPALAQAIGFSFHAGAEPRRQLLGYLRGKQMLLVMDNVEQLIGSSRGEGDGRRRGEGVELLLEVLRGAPGIQLLVTSRVRLNASGEYVLAVPGMDVPPPSDGQALRYSAVQLYLQQARRARPGYAPTGEAVAQIGRICRLVGGMPLAIVLAAAWMDVLSPVEIAAELERSIAFLRSELRDLPERHHSMVAAFDVSWGMLSAAERDAFAALSVFRGGCTREAAEAVADVGLEILRALVRKSFLTRDEDGRYQVHELLRQYGEDKLRQRPEAWERARDRHCVYYAEYMAQRKDSFRKLGPGIARLETGNLYAAWRWMLNRERVAECRRALGGICWFDEGWAWHNTRRPLLEDTVALLRRAEPSRENRIALAMALCYLSVSPIPDPQPALAREGHQILTELDARRELAEAKMLAWVAGIAEDDAHADRLLHESLSLAQETDAPIEEAWALFALGKRYLERAIVDGRPEGGAWRWAQEAYSKALKIYRRIGHRRGEAIVLIAQAQCAHARGRYMRARSLYEESLALFRELDVREWTLYCLRDLGSLALITGDPQVARSCYLEGLEKAQAWGNPLEARYLLCGLGEVALATGELCKADGFSRRGLQGAIEDGGLGAERVVLSMAKRSAQSGERTRAAELLAFAFHISVETVGLAGGRELEQALQEHLPPESYAAAQERSRARDMEATLRELVAELQGEEILPELQRGERADPGASGNGARGATAVGAGSCAV